MPGNQLVMGLATALLVLPLGTQATPAPSPPPEEMKLPGGNERLSDYGATWEEDITGDTLLEAFEVDESVAIDTVRTNLNRAFASLNTAVERRRNGRAFLTPAAPKALPEAAATGISTPHLVEKTPVRR